MKSLDSNVLTSDICIVNNISFYWWRWFVSWLIFNPTLPSSDFTVGVEIITLQAGTCSLTNLFKFSNWSEISLEVNLLASFVPAWIIKWLDFFLINAWGYAAYPPRSHLGNFEPVPYDFFYVTFLQKLHL